jgi:hypothetical protein
MLRLITCKEKTLPGRTSRDLARIFPVESRTRPNYTSSLLSAGVYASMVPITIIGCAAYVLTALCLANLRTFTPPHDRRSRGRPLPWPDRCELSLPLPAPIASVQGPVSGQATVPSVIDSGSGQLDVNRQLAAPGYLAVVPSKCGTANRTTRTAHGAKFPVHGAAQRRRFLTLSGSGEWERPSLRGRA